MLINNNGLENELNGEKITGEIFKDEATRKKVQTHIVDPEDTITEEDIRKVKTEMTPATLDQEREAAEDIGIDVPGDGL